jgi:hypothetical protein
VHRYNFFIGKGQCPGGPPDWVSQKIVKLHLESTSMLTVNPIQDYIDCWETLRSEAPPPLNLSVLGCPLLHLSILVPRHG